jgi:hemoglobin-like flavoprotein
MGCRHSKVDVENHSEEKTETLLESRIKEELKNSPDSKTFTIEEIKQSSEILYYKNPTISLNGEIQHYIPATFPITVIVTFSDIINCRRSYNKIIKEGKHTLLIDLFYNNLFEVNPCFKKYFTNMRDKASIASNALSFIIDCSLVGKAREARIKSVCARHRQIGLPFWYYSQYLTCLLRSILCILEDKLTEELSQSWVNVFNKALHEFLEGLIQSDKDIPKLQYGVAKYNKDHIKHVNLIEKSKTYIDYKPRLIPSPRIPRNFLPPYTSGTFISS